MSGVALDLGSLRDAVQSLSDALEVVGNPTWFAAQDAKVRNTLIAGVVQNFEFVYEISVKMIRRRLELDALSPAEVDRANFRELLREAGEKGLIDDVEAWFGYRRMRNVTARTYDHAKAIQVYHDTMRFVGDARSLLARLEARNA
jgi:nucleotidyltransferase substrate binding protein (TIGR01987 family)